MLELFTFYFQILLSSLFNKVSKCDCSSSCNRKALIQPVELVVQMSRQTNKIISEWTTEWRQSHTENHMLCLFKDIIILLYQNIIIGKKFSYKGNRNGMDNVTLNNITKKSMYEPDCWYWISVQLPDLFT